MRLALTEENYRFSFKARDALSVGYALGQGALIDEVINRKFLPAAAEFHRGTVYRDVGDWSGIEEPDLSSLLSSY